MQNLFSSTIWLERIQLHTSCLAIVLPKLHYLLVNTTHKWYYKCHPLDLSVFVYARVYVFVRVCGCVFMCVFVFVCFYHKIMWIFIVIISLWMLFAFLLEGNWLHLQQPRINIKATFFLLGQPKKRARSLVVNEGCPVWVPLLAMCRGELPEVIIWLMVKCLWSKWNW